MPACKQRSFSCVLQLKCAAMCACVRHLPSHRRATTVLKPCLLYLHHLSTMCWLSSCTDKHASCIQAAWQRHALPMQEVRWCDLAADTAADVNILAICATGKLWELHVRVHYSLRRHSCNWFACTQFSLQQCLYVCMSIYIEYKYLTYIHHM